MSELAPASEHLYLDQRDHGKPEPQTPTYNTIREVMDIAKRIATKGETRQKIISSLMEEKGYSLASAVKRYESAIRFLTPTAEEQDNFREKMMGKQMARYEHLYEKALERNAIGVARDVLDSITKLFGLAQQNKVEIKENAEGDRVINISFD